MKTNKVKKVLIAMDYSSTTQKVAETGLSLANAMKAEVVLLHVISDPVYYTSAECSSIMGFTGFMNMDPLQLENVKELKRASRQFLNKSKHHLGNKNIRTLVKEGDFAGSILETAKNLHIDVIVMGSHSRKWLENILMGSVTEEVLHQTSIPLFIVPTKHKR